MNIIEQTEAIAREAWEKSEPEEAFENSEPEDLEGRRASREVTSWPTPAEERRLAFIRWLVTTGRLTEQVDQ